MKNRRGRRQQIKGLKPHEWQNAATLGRIGQLNEKCLAIFATAPPCPQLWRDMNERACKRASTVPVLLGNLRFHDDDWWDRIACTSERHSENRGPVAIGSLHPATPVIREILVEAHLVARSNSAATKFVFDMSQRVVEVMAALAPAEMEWIASQCAEELKLRWGDRAVFWNNLIVAAIGTDNQALSRVHLHAIQLIGSVTSS